MRQFTFRFTAIFTAIMAVCMVFQGLVSTTAMAQTRAACPDKGYPSIAIALSSDPIQYDFTKNKAQLRSFKIDTKSPYDQHAHTEVGGLMNGEISVNTNVTFGWSTQGRNQETCYWYDQIQVRMHIDPTILVASDHPQGTCMHSSILEHEMKHIKVDRKVLQKYKDLIESDLNRVVAKVGTIGPVSKGSSDKIRERMMAVVEKTVATRTQAMYAERRTLQQAVDSLDEYERVASRCPAPAATQ